MKPIRGFARVLVVTALLVTASAVVGGRSAEAKDERPPRLSFPAVDAEPLGAVPEGAVVLYDGWQMREEAIAGNHPDRFSAPDFTAADWYSTTVPTTTLATLIRHGLYPDPYVGTNSMLIPDASDAMNRRYDLGHYSHLPDKSNPWARPYWFRTTFADPAAPGQTVWLHLDGVNYRADVWVNGVQVGDARQVAGMFRRFRFDVTRLLSRDKPNALAVRVHPLDFPGDPVAEQLGGLMGDFGPNGGDAEILRNVTQYCSIGWDWVPAVRDRNVGLWQHVWLEATGPVAVRDPAAWTELKSPDGRQAAVTVRGYLENPGLQTVSAELLARIEPDGFAGPAVELRTPVAVPPGAPIEFVLKPAEHPQLVLEHLRLWWPVGYGGQSLYKLTVEAHVAGRTSSRATARFGVRSVGTCILKSGGRAFSVNGRILRLTGGAWIPDMLMSWSAQRYRDEIRLMAEGNHTVVRVNGCGIVPPEVFFDACDRQGVLVWQDLSRTSVDGTYRKDGRKGWNPPDCDPALYLANMRDCILRLRGHPSMLVWCGSNEATAQQDIGTALQNELLPTLDGSRPWLTSSSENAPWRKEDNRVWTGGPWHQVPLPDYFKLYRERDDYTTRDEIGLASVLPINSLVRAIPDWDRPDPATFPLNRTLGFHDATFFQFRCTHDLIAKNIGQAANLTEYLCMGDLFNAASYRAIFEAANKARPRNAGTHLWKVNAAWPSMMWQVFDWYLRPNAGYYAMKSACKPLHVQHSLDDQGLQVVSTLAENRPALKLRVELVDAAGHPEYSADRSVDAKADATTPAGRLPELVKDGRLYFLRLTLSDPEGRQLDRTVTWAQKDCQWRELIAMAPATVQARVTMRKTLAGETLCGVAVENVSAVPAVNVWIELLQGPQGRELLPSFWSDNALTLLPGERRELTVRLRTCLWDAAVPHLSVEGWNVVPQQWNVADAAPVPSSFKVTGTDIRSIGGRVEVFFTATRSSAAGPRLTTWPVPVRIDGKPVRYVRVGVPGGGQAESRLTFTGLPPGVHQIAVGSVPPQDVKVP
jgi:exo-1,4-beta-D-glucosaminidase